MTNTVLNLLFLLSLTSAITSSRATDGHAGRGLSEHRQHHERAAITPTAAVWSSTGASTTIAITTAEASGRCGAAHGTRTMCVPSQTCHSVSTGYSTCAKATSNSSTTTRTAIQAKTTASTTTKSATSFVPLASPVSLLAYTGPKRGLSYNNAKLTLPFKSHIGWAYNWGQTKNGNLTAGVQYVPMLWNDAAARVADWDTHVKAAIANGATHLLGFNEPDLSTQAGMTVAEAVAAWKKYMQPYAGKLKLVSPAVTNGGSPMGVTYLKNFINSCTGCTIDAVALHWYDSATNVAGFKNYLNNAATMFSPKPIWLTEFQGSGTVAQQVTFIKTVVPWLHNHAFIKRYALFGLSDGPAADGHMVTNGQLNAVGSAYATAT